MACRKCGSDWKTATGRDCQSCPHCNKLQRHLARKAGRWVEATEQAICKTCGKEFTNVGANVGKARCCSPECVEAHRKAWRTAYSADYKGGLRRGTQTSRRLPKPICKRCCKAFKRKYGGHNANLYCSKKCFYDARDAGDHKWDKTNQLKATWHKCGPYSSAPSAMAMRHIAKCWKHIFKCKNLLPKMMALAASQPKCEVCGSSCSDGAARFCSYECNKEWRGDRQCRCGVIVHKCTAFGPPPACKECRRKTQREWRRISKSTRGRVRRGGGYWNPQVKAFGVFKRDNWTCYMCKAKCEKVYAPLNPLSATVDHVYPVAAGGDHDWHNVRTACASCNSRKGDRIKGQRLLRLK